MRCGVRERGRGGGRAAEGVLANGSGARGGGGGPRGGLPSQWGSRGAGSRLPESSETGGGAAGEWGRPRPHRPRAPSDPRFPRPGPPLPALPRPRGPARPWGPPGAGSGACQQRDARPAGPDPALGGPSAPRAAALWGFAVLRDSCSTGPALWFPPRWGCPRAVTLGRGRYIARGHPGTPGTRCGGRPVFPGGVGGAGTGWGGHQLQVPGLEPEPRGTDSALAPGRAPALGVLIGWRFSGGAAYLPPVRAARAPSVSHAPP